LGLAVALLYVDPEGRADELLRVTEEAIPVLEELGDEAGLAAAWMGVAQVHHLAARMEERREVHERALVHAQRAGHGRLVAECRGYLTGALLFGPTSAADAIERAQTILADVQGNAAHEARSLGHLAALHAMQGHLEEAGQLCTRLRALSEELGG